MANHIPQSRASVLRNVRICSDHYQMTLQEPFLATVTQPGQFVNLLINDREDLLLRRPFSVAMTNPQQSTFDIVYRVVGKGTLAMTSLKSGEIVDLLGPFGVGFHLPEQSVRCLLLGGGCGVAPLWGLAQALAKARNPMVALIGFQSSDKVFGEEIFRSLGADVVVTTDDGSYGKRGFVSQHLGVILNQGVERLYVCGPHPMLKAVFPMIKKANIKTEVSLEERMGCGYGVCLSCVASIVKNGQIERQRICTEGPVFNLEDIVLDDQA